METPVVLTPEEERKLGEIEATMKNLAEVGSAIAELLDIRGLGIPLSDFEKGKQEELLVEEDELRARLRQLNGPSWESNRRWA